MKLNKVTVELLHESTLYHMDSTSIFYHLCKNKSSTLLLESAEIKYKQNVESMIIIDSAIKITALGSVVQLKALSVNGQELLLLLDNILPKSIYIIKKDFNFRKLIFPMFNINTDEDSKLHNLSIFDCLRLLINLVKQPKSESLKSMFFGGLFSYDLISNFEDLPILKAKQKCKDYCFYLAETLLILDHKKQICTLQCSLFSKNKLEKQRLKKRILELKNKLNVNILDSIPCKKISKMHLLCNQNNKKYYKIIEYMKNKINDGEIFQVVPSRKFYLPCISPLSSYNTLKLNNLSPYMFFMQDEEFTLFGTSPESSLKYDPSNRQVELYPIAGTRARSFLKNGLINQDLDNKIELEMRSDQKELSEHLMLVDLARNDLARICVPGTRYVADLIKVDKYSFVMHLVSRVVGKLKNEFDMLHAYQACMNMGTLSGAPKIRAMQLISKVEQERRGSYGGSIGYFTGSGILNTCIVIRSAYIEKEIATIQAGAGIVLNSIPELEAEESLNKARAVLNAIITSHKAMEVYYDKYFTS
ncbi:MAG: anthranilate synthase component 1 [Enterobacterales bacterium]